MGVPLLEQSRELGRGPHGPRRGGRRRDPRGRRPGLGTGDVSDFQHARALVESAVEEFGKLDILVNNAGILRDRMVFSMSEEEWDAVIGVHLKGHKHHPLRRRALAGPLEGGGRAGVRADREHVLGGVPGGLGRAAQLRGGQGRNRRPHHVDGARPRQVRRHRERDLPARPDPYDRGRVRRLGTTGRRPGPARARACRPLVGYLASPAPAQVNGQLLVVHGGMVAIVERPRVGAKFDTEQDAFTYDELDALLTPHYAERPRGETFAAVEVLGLRHERASGDR